MEEREAVIRRWFGMWLTKEDAGILDIFSPDAAYLESWGPEYHGAEKIQLWFREWNKLSTVLRWDIRQFFHKGDQTVVEWDFQCSMGGDPPNGFEGMSLIRWTEDGKICFLQEFGCKGDRYDPYQDGPEPKFREEEIAWF